MSALFVEEMYRGIKGGSEFQIVLRIGAPYEKVPDEFVTQVTIEGLLAKDQEIINISPLTSLCTAIKFIAIMITGFIEGGGTVTYLDDEEPLSVSHIFVPLFSDSKSFSSDCFTAPES